METRQWGELPIFVMKYKISKYDPILPLKFGRKMMVLRYVVTKYGDAVGSSHLVYV